MTARFGCALVASAALLSMTSWVYAQPDAQPDPQVEADADPVSPESEEEAKRLYAEADTHYAAGRYGKAVEAFSKSYELSGRAELLFNIANAYERNGDYQKAADYLKKYGASPAAADVSSINERIKRLETNAAEKRERELEEAKRKDAEAVVPPAVKQPDGVGLVREPEPSGRGETRSRTPGWVFLGVGAAFLAGGVVTGVVARSAGNDARDLCTDDGVCPQEASDDLDRERNLGIAADISMGVGVAAVGVGLYLVLRGGGSNENATVTISPSSDGAAVAYVGRF